MTEILSLLVGLLLGAILQHWFDILGDKKKRIQELRAKAYSDFLSAVARVAVAQANENEEAIRLGTSDMIDAKARICVYGEASVAKALADFWNSGGKLDNPDSQEAFLTAVQNMRNPDLSGREIRKEDIETLLYK